MAEIFALTYEHKHGTDLSLWVSEAAATKGLAEIAREWWLEAFERAEPEDLLPDQAPVDDQRAIDLYFLVMGEERNLWEPESYCIEALEVQG